jgi:hypothetical protein
MKRVLWLIALLGALLLSSAPILADDGFYVIAGRPSVGTRITSLPHTINNPGYYYLTGNLTCPSGQDGITVAADNVTIDLLGFCLNGPDGSWVNTGISMNGRNNVEIRNGSMTYWSNCIVEQEGSNHRVINVRVQCYDSGINLGGVGHIIQGCTAYRCIKGLTMATGVIRGCTVIGYDPTSYGIKAGGTISSNVVLDCTTADATGIYGIAASISHNVVSNCGTGISGGGGGSIIGNVVLANLGQTGIVPSTTSYPNVLDQNTVGGDGTHYGPGSSETVLVFNAGMPSPN